MSRPFCCAAPPGKALDTDSWDPAGGIKDGRKKKKKGEKIMRPPLDPFLKDNVMEW